MLEKDNSNLIKHLEFIQITIIRMATNSFLIKGWVITLVSAILAFTVAKEQDHVNGVWLALIPAFIFWGLDAYYLRQERLFRALYDHIRTKKHNNANVDFSLDTTPFTKRINKWIRVCVSSTLLGFYLPLIIVIGGVIYYLYC